MLTIHTWPDKHIKIKLIKKIYTIFLPDKVDWFGRQDARSSYGQDQEDFDDVFPKSVPKTGINLLLYFRHVK